MACGLDICARDIGGFWNLIGDLPSEIPRGQIGDGSVLKTPAGGKQQVIMLVKIITAAKIKPSAVLARDRVGGLMEYFATECQFFGDFPLQ